MHQLRHLFIDIQRKGTCENFSCTLGESFHQGLITAYQRTNKKNAAGQVYTHLWATNSSSFCQILSIESRMIALSRIRWRINESKTSEDNEQIAGQDIEPEYERENSDGATIDLEQGIWNGARLGSKETRPSQVNSLLVQYEKGYFKDYKGLPTFTNFHSDLKTFLLSEAARLVLPGPIDFSGLVCVCAICDILTLIVLHQITISKVLWHSYYSMDDGLLRMDPIRCNPSAYNSVRFDTILVQAQGGMEVAKLLLMFEVSAFHRIWQIARVQYFRYTSAPTVDEIIGQSRYASQDKGEFILLSSIIRSCHLVPIHDVPGDYYLNDLVAGDTDMYLRCNQIDTQ